MNHAGRAPAQADMIDQREILKAQRSGCNHQGQWRVRQGWPSAAPARRTRGRGRNRPDPSQQTGPTR
jgi:hypothetical protein